MLFATALCLNALLIFWVQPLFAKMVLPLLGGSPSVWTTCMLFFQAALLAGYAYGHASIRVLGLRRHAMLHGVLVWLPLLLLPMTKAQRRRQVETVMADLADGARVRVATDRRERPMHCHH